MHDDSEDIFLVISRSKSFVCLHSLQLFPIFIHFIFHALVNSQISAARPIFKFSFIPHKWNSAISPVIRRRVVIDKIMKLPEF